MSSVTCEHCGNAFFPEAGTSCDDCPTCGRTWYAPALDDDDVREAVERLGEEMRHFALDDPMLADLRTLLRSHAAQAERIEKLLHEFEACGWRMWAEYKRAKKAEAELAKTREGLEAEHDAEKANYDAMSKACAKALAERDALKERVEGLEKAAKSVWLWLLHIHGGYADQRLSDVRRGAEVCAQELQASLRGAEGE